MFDELQVFLLSKRIWEMGEKGPSSENWVNYASRKCLHFNYLPPPWKQILYRHISYRQWTVNYIF